MARIALIFVADDALREVLALALRADGYCVLLAASDDVARERLALDRPDLLVLDRLMPLPEPAEQWADRQAAGVPLVLLDSHGDDPLPLRSPTTVALSMPFGRAALRRAVASVIRHGPEAAWARVVGDDLVVTPSGSAWRAGAPVELNPTERRLLAAFAADPDAPARAQALSQALWGNASSAGEAYLSLYLGRLRQKLEVGLAAPRSLRAAKGGFVFATVSATRRTLLPGGGRRERALARTGPHTVLTIGLDRPMAAAVRADLPRARIRAIRPHRGGRMGAGWRTPDLIILNASATDATRQRRLVQQRWATAVVVELSATESRALVWRPPADVEIMEFGPGFLTPFLPIRSAPDAPGARLLPALRFTGYAAVLWHLVAGLANDNSASLLIGVGTLPVLLASLYREARQELRGV
jgi:DNA-binding response OmpR family regulator